MIHATPVLVSDQSQESKNLERDRVQLLNSIHELSRHPSGLEKREEIKSLRKDYNQVISRQLIANRGPWTDPLSILPLEIWVHIIEEIFDNRLGSSYRVIANMVLVGKEWKEAIVNTPQFWTVITIDPTFQESDLLERVHTSLYLSKDHPLTILLDFPIDQASYHACLSLLSPHSSRIRRFFFRNPSRNQGGSMAREPSVHRVLSDFLPLPNLQELQFGNFWFTNETEWNILESFPQIKSVEGDGLPLNVMRRVSLVNLENLKTYGSVGKLFAITAALPQLKDLEMVESAYSDWATEDSIEPEHGDSPPPLPEQPLGIETLTWHRYNESRLRDLIHFSPRLKSLTLLVSWKSLASVLEEMSNLPLLSYLSVYLQRKPDEDKFSPTTITQSLSLRDFDFEVGYFGSESDSENRSKLNGNLSQFLAAWRPTIERLESASICLGAEWALPSTLLQSFRRVKVLNLTLFAPSLPELPKLTLDALEDLRLQIPVRFYVNFLSSLQCPNLLLLKIQTNTTSYLEKANIHLDPENFPRLSGLHWSSTQLNWIISSHKNLKLIVFIRGGSVASNFCAHLILRPLDFPSLEQLEFYEFPEWDLIILMLERRNFLLEASISRIRTLVLPTTLGFILKTPLTLLLGGQFSNRLSNYDLSIAGIAEVYFDKALSGCHWCCLSMQACSSHTTLTYYASPSHTRWSQHKADPITITPDPPLTDSILKWLNQRQERYDQWKEKAEKTVEWTRGNVCDSHQLSSLFVFSSFSTANPLSYRSVAVGTLDTVID